MSDHLAPTPWSVDKYGNLVDARGNQILMRGVALPFGACPEADAHRDLLLEASDLRRQWDEAVEVLQAVEEWWLTQGMQGQTGAPVCIFLARQLLATLAPTGAATGEDPR